MSSRASPRHPGARYASAGVLQSVELDAATHGMVVAATGERLLKVPSSCRAEVGLAFLTMAHRLTLRRGTALKKGGSQP